MLGTLTKRTGDQLDYDVDFEKWLTDDDEIETATAMLVDADEVDDMLEVESVQITSPIVKVWLSGGVDGTSYTVLITATTTAGRIKEETFTIRVRD